MNQEEITKVFQEHGKKCDTYGMYKCRLLEVRVNMKDGSNLIILFPEKAYIDISNSDESSYVGFGGTLIEPMANIQSIECKWRGIERFVTYGECGE